MSSQEDIEYELADFIRKADYHATLAATAFRLGDMADFVIEFAMAMFYLDAGGE